MAFSARYDVVDAQQSNECTPPHRLTSVVDIEIAPMNPYQPLPLHILSYMLTFQSRILIYADSNI